MSAVITPSILKCIEVLGENEGKSIHRELVKSEFRSAASLKDQIKYLKKIRPAISVRVITKLLNISNNRYYHALNEDAKTFQIQLAPPSQRLLTEEEENDIIMQIHIHQLQNDCLTGKEIRKIASDLYHKRTGTLKEFSRDWIMDFRNRQKDNIEKVSASSVDENRANISIDEVNRYLSQVDEMMKDPPNPFLLINFDEIGFGKRAQKGKRKNVYVIKNLDVKPFWREQTDIHHISVVAAVSAACSSITPLFLSTRKKLDEDLKQTLFLRSCNYFQTEKGYMTILSTVFWVRNNLAPYVEYVRSIIGKDEKCVIIADGLKTHFHQIVMEELEKIGNISLILLPPHSSHLAQVLDLTVFNVFKTNYFSTFSNCSFSSQFTSKLMKIKIAYQKTFNDEVIQSGWEKAGFKLNINEGEIVSYEFSDGFKDFLRSQALHRDPQSNE